MVNRAKCGTAVIMACFLALWPAIFALSMCFHRSQMQRTIELTLKESAAETFNLKKAIFPTLNKQKEFDFKGQRYDIVSITDQVGYWRVVAINDEKEKWMEQQAEKESHKSGIAGGWLIVAPGSKVFKIRMPLTMSKLLPVHSSSNVVCGHTKDFYPPPERVI